MLITLIAFLLVLGLLVLVHEFGHFWVARRCGVGVEEFGMGLPPRAIGFYKNEQGKWQKLPRGQKTAPSTIYSLNWTPLGGFVRIKGEAGEAAQEPDSFAGKSVSKRIAIISAGVIMNILLAAVLIGIGLTIGSPQVVDEATISKHAQVSDRQITIVEVLENLPADAAGIEVGDRLQSVDGQTFTQVSSFQELINGKTNQEVTVVLDRAGEVVTLELTPTLLAETQRGGIGVSLVATAKVSYPWYIAWWYGIVETFKMIGSIIYGFYTVIVQLVTTGTTAAEVYGPIGIASLVGQAADLGFLYVMQFTATLSVIIAVMNFLPIPALDGGRVVFLLLEAVRGKPVDQKIEAIIHNIGFALLMALIVLITFKDFARIFSAAF